MMHKLRDLLEESLSVQYYVDLEVMSAVSGIRSTEF